VLGAETLLAAAASAPRGPGKALPPGAGRLALRTWRLAHPVPAPVRRRRPGVQGIERLIKALQARGIAVYLISGGFR
jgi:hypothetical protein